MRAAEITRCSPLLIAALCLVLLSGSASLSVSAQSASLIHYTGSNCTGVASSPLSFAQNTCTFWPFNETIAGDRYFKGWLNSNGQAIAYFFSDSSCAKDPFQANFAQTGQCAGNVLVASGQAFSGSFPSFPPSSTGWVINNRCSSSGCGGFCAQEASLPGVCQLIRPSKAQNVGGKSAAIYCTTDGKVVTAAYSDTRCISPAFTTSSLANQCNVNDNSYYTCQSGASTPQPAVILPQSGFASTNTSTCSYASYSQWINIPLGQCLGLVDEDKGTASGYRITGNATSAILNLYSDIQCNSPSFTISQANDGCTNLGSSGLTVHVAKQTSVQIFSDSSCQSTSGMQTFYLQPGACVPNPFPNTIAGPNSYVKTYCASTTQASAFFYSDSACTNLVSASQAPLDTCSNNRIVTCPDGVTPGSIPTFPPSGFAVSTTCSDNSCLTACSADAIPTGKCIAQGDGTSPNGFAQLFCNNGIATTAIYDNPSCAGPVKFASQSTTGQCLNKASIQCPTGVSNTLPPLPPATLLNFQTSGTCDVTQPHSTAFFPPNLCTATSGTASVRVTCNNGTFSFASYANSNCAGTPSSTNFLIDQCLYGQYKATCPAALTQYLDDSCQTRDIQMNVAPGMCQPYAVHPNTVDQQFVTSYCNADGTATRFIYSDSACTNVVRAVTQPVGVCADRFLANCYPSSPSGGAAPTFPPAGFNTVKQFLGVSDPSVCSGPVSFTKASPSGCAGSKTPLTSVNSLGSYCIGNMMTDVSYFDAQCTSPNFAATFTADGTTCYSNQIRTCGTGTALPSSVTLPASTVSISAASGSTPCTTGTPIEKVNVASNTCTPFTNKQSIRLDCSPDNSNATLSFYSGPNCDASSKLSSVSQNSGQCATNSRYEMTCVSQSTVTRYSDSQCTSVKGFQVIKPDGTCQPYTLPDTRLVNQYVQSYCLPDGTFKAFIYADAACSNLVTAAAIPKTDTCLGSTVVHCATTTTATPPTFPPAGFAIETQYNDDACTQLPVVTVERPGSCYQLRQDGPTPTTGKSSGLWCGTTDRVTMGSFSDTACTSLISGSSIPTNKCNRRLMISCPGGAPLPAVAFTNIATFASNLNSNCSDVASAALSIFPENTCVPFGSDSPSSLLVACSADGNATLSSYGDQACSANQTSFSFKSPSGSCQFGQVLTCNAMAPGGAGGNTLNAAGHITASLFILALTIIAAMFGAQQL